MDTKEMHVFERFPLKIRPRSRSLSDPRARTGAVGALALGAVALGAFAIGALAIGRLAIGRARIRRVEIDELVVRKLRVTETLQTPPSRNAGGAADDVSKE